MRAAMMDVQRRSIEMRIVAGKFRSQLLVAPKGWKTRPTSDRLRETLFNVLAPRIERAVFADLFAGTGAVGIEALSRGAERVYFAGNRGNRLWRRYGVTSKSYELDWRRKVDPVEPFPCFGAF